MPKKSISSRLSARILLASSLGVALLTGLTSCGGGGGGEGGGGGSTLDASTRTTGTGVRIIHASLDVEPVDLKIAEQYLNHGAFMDVTYFAKAPGGLTDVTLERGNSPGVSIFSNKLELGDKIEYSLLLSGSVTNRNFAVTVLEEPVSRPEKGFARVQLVHALEGSGTITAQGAGITLGPVPFRTATESITVPSGAQTFVVTNNRGGVIANLPVTLADRGEATIVIGGDAARGVSIPRVFTDLD